MLPSKCENNFGTLYKRLFFQYCDSNIGLFSIATHLVIALQTLLGRAITLEREPRTDTKKKAKRIKSANFTRSNR